MKGALCEVLGTLVHVINLFCFMSFQYNGVNLRCATYEQAAMILKQSGNSVTILAQFNPQKFKEPDESSSQSEASTTCSTQINKKNQDGSISTPPIRRDEKVLPIIDNEPPGDLRYVFFTKSPGTLGFSIAGGNAMGIFVSEVQTDCGVPGTPVISVGDQILEVCKMSLQLKMKLSETCKCCQYCAGSWMGTRLAGPTLRVLKLTEEKVFPLV